jgi:hypothetical protein
MKLPNFYVFEPLNVLKEKMGLPRDAVGGIDVFVDPGRLTAVELERLTSQDGLDISLDDLKVLEDGTLAYKDSRVLLYIRDVPIFGDRESEPRYHLSNCSTLKEMRERKRFNSRYVVSTRTDGIFNLNMIKGANTATKLTRLAVCQNCLGFLSFNGFRMYWGRPQRTRAVRSFSLGEFFQQYPRSLHTQAPKYNSDNAPLNIYSPDFERVSKVVRAAAGYRCESCEVGLSLEAHKRFLHTHHIDGDKSNNDISNLKALCLVCHAKEHPGMKSLPEFKQFQQLRTELLRARQGLIPGSNTVGVTGEELSREAIYRRSLTQEGGS